MKAALNVIIGQDTNLMYKIKQKYLINQTIGKNEQRKKEEHLFDRFLNSN